MARIEALTKSVMNRLLHEPTVQLKKAGGHGRLQLTRELFGLEEGTPEQAVAASGDNVRELRRRA